MTIGQVARRAGVTQSSIRYYEAAGLLPRPSRRNGLRVYDDDAVDRLKILRFFRRAGITIRSLTTMTSQQHGSSVRREVVLGVLQRRIADLDALMIEAKAMKQRLEESIACRCEGVTAKCSIIQADEDIAEPQTKRTKPTQ
jgi:MerR family redox-sensitive transcriptional activator SoxR